MNEHIQALNQRLIGIFEHKEREFTKYSEEDGDSGLVAAQIADLYADLIEVMRR